MQLPVGLDPLCLGSDRDAPDPLDCGGDLDDDGAADDVDDDDGDDVADATACRVPGAGADDDGACLCDGADPFPACARSDPVGCTPAAPIACE